MTLPYFSAARSLPIRVRDRIILGATAIALLALGVVACTPGQTTSAGNVAGSVVSATGIGLSTLQPICAKYEPIIGTAAQQTAGAPPSTVAGKISATAAFGVAFCSQVQAGVIPSTANGNSVSWLSEIAGMIKALAPLASLVIPLL
jgi:hypothetical protein